MTQTWTFSLYVLMKGTNTKLTNEKLLETKKLEICNFGFLNHYVTILPSSPSQAGQVYKDTLLIMLYVV